MVKIKIFLRNFDFLKVYNSPFIRPKIKLYFGDIDRGVPYFYPRKWIKDRDKPGYLKATPKKIGFDFVGMKWKTKWQNTDYRFESGPIWSFVAFGKQIAVTFVVPELDHYWECWLYYTRNTDKTKSIKERIKEARQGFPCKWMSYKNGNKEGTAYCGWDLILKDKWL
jgi:hypothetical protein